MEEEEKRHHDCVVIHLFIYKLIKEKSHRGRGFKQYIPHSCLKELLQRRFNHLPRVILNELIKELEELKLIKKIGATNAMKYELIGKDKDKLLNKLNFLP